MKRFYTNLTFSIICKQKLHVEKNYLLFATTILHIIFLVFILFYSTLSFSQQNKLSQTDKAKEIISSRKEVVVLFHKPSGISLEQLSKIIYIDYLKNDTIRAYITGKQLKAFLSLNIDFEIIKLPAGHITLKSGGSIWEWNKYPTYPEYTAMMDSFVRAYPSLCTLLNAGKSVNGHDILFIKINTDTIKIKPAVMYTSTMHGDELGGYVLMLRLIDFLLKNYKNDSLVTHLVDSLEIWINPLTNPDGTYFLNDSDVWQATRTNANGVDLNRNYLDPVMGPYPEGGSYQPETNAIMNLMNQHHFALSANFHSGSEVVNYPWDSKPALHPDDSWFRYISKEYADSAIYYGQGGYFKTIIKDETIKGITNGWAWYTVYGGQQDCITYFYEGREVIIEIDATKLTPESNLNNLWNYNYRSLLHYLEQAMYGIRGFVYDSITGKPVKAKIELVGHDDNSSAIHSDSLKGNYYRFVYEGNYTLRCSAPDYYTKEFNDITIGNRETKYLNIYLKPGNKSSTAKLETTGLTIYPNPCNNLFYIKSNDFLLTSISFEIMDITGKTMIYSKNANLNKPVNVGYLKPGIYYLKITIPNNTVIKELTVLR